MYIVVVWIVCRWVDFFLFRSEMRRSSWNSTHVERVRTGPHPSQALHAMQGANPNYAPCEINSTLVYGQKLVEGLIP